MNIGELVTTEGLKLLQTSLTLAGNEIPKIASEIINYMIFLSAIGILKTLLIGVIPVIIVKFLNLHISEHSVLLKELKERDEKVRQSSNWNLKYQSINMENNISAAKLSRLLIPLVFCIAMSWNIINETITIGKVLIAPRLFVLEQMKLLVKPHQIVEKSPQG